MIFLKIPQATILKELTLQIDLCIWNKQSLDANKNKQTIEIPKYIDIMFVIQKHGIHYFHN